jgi:hypothetical protein
MIKYIDMDFIKIVSYTIYVVFIIFSIISIVLGILFGLPSSTINPPIGTQLIWEYILFCGSTAFILSFIGLLMIFIIFRKWVPKGYSRDPDFPDGFEMTE